MFTTILLVAKEWLGQENKSRGVMLDASSPLDNPLYKVRDCATIFIFLFADIKDVVNALDEIEPIDDTLIPTDAFIREFIGGSSLSY